MFQEDLASKVVTLGLDEVSTTVTRDTQCRGCSEGTNPHWISPLQHSLLDHQCIAESDECRYFQHSR